MTNNPQKVLSRVVTTPSGCWEWQGCLGSGGYGLVAYQGKAQRVHRVVYMLSVGPIPEGLVLDHLCRNRKCCNPEHLEPVTLEDNIKRGDLHAHGDAQRSKTHCPQGHEYNEVNTHIDRTNARRCRACDRERKRVIACEVKK